MTKDLLNDTELEVKLVTSPAPRVTLEYMQSRIKTVHYVFMKDVSPEQDLGTICTIYLDNGYSIRGEAACVNPENFDKDIGKRIAYDNALDKLWPLFGFLLAESQFQGVAAEKSEVGSGLKKADLSTPYLSAEKLDVWIVEEQLYPESRGYILHEFTSLALAQQFITQAKD